MVLNSEHYQTESLIAYAKENAVPVTFEKNELPEYKLFITDLLVRDQYTSQKGDKLNRSLVRHDPKALHEVYKQVLNS